MTTDLSQHYLHNDLHPQAHPQKEDPPFPTAKAEGFPTAKAGYTTAYWVAAGAGVLIATGVAAFTSFNNVPEPPAGSAQTVPLLATESDSVANAVFGDEAAELAESDASEVSEPEASPSTALGAAPPGSHRAAEPNLTEAQRLEAPSLAEPLADGEPPAADALIPATAGAFYVQLASYRTKETADTHAQALASRGFSAQSVAYGGPAAGWWHAVRLGPFGDRAAAEKSRFDLEVADRRAAYVLPRSNGKFHVQVASFAEHEEAEQVAKSLSANGHATKVTRVKMSGSYWHCVRIGPFDTREEAVAYKALVPDVPGSQSTVIPFPPPPAR